MIAPSLHSGGMGEGSEPLIVITLDSLNMIKLLQPGEIHFNCYKRRGGDDEVVIW